MIAEMTAEPYAPRAGETVELALTDELNAAISHAFAEACRSLSEGGSLTPFTIFGTSDGFDVTDHRGNTVEEIYASVAALVRRDAPEFYVFAYDGFVEAGGASGDAILCEVAYRAGTEAYLLALPYTVCAEGYVFSQDYLYAGTAQPIYPCAIAFAVNG